jgi:DNA-binding XRE family transcriptional regulator
MRDLEKAYDKVVSLLRQYEELAKTDLEHKVKYIIASNLRIYRAKNKLTQEELAKELDVNRIQIIRWEKGQCKPGRMVINMLERHGILKKGLLKKK